LTPRIQSTLPEIRNLLLRAARRPSRLAIWITAAIAAVVMAVSACAALPAVSVTGMAGSNHAKNVGDSGQDGAPAAATRIRAVGVGRVRPHGQARQCQQDQCRTPVAPPLAGARGRGG